LNICFLKAVIVLLQLYNDCYSKSSPIKINYAFVLHNANWDMESGQRHVFFFFFLLYQFCFGASN